MYYYKKRPDLQSITNLVGPYIQVLMPELSGPYPFRDGLSTNKVSSALEMKKVENSDLIHIAFTTSAPYSENSDITHYQMDMKINPYSLRDTRIKFSPGTKDDPCKEKQNFIIQRFSELITGAEFLVDNRGELYTKPETQKYPSIQNPVEILKLREFTAFRSQYRNTRRYG